MIEKSRLGYFPPVGERFQLTEGRAMTFCAIEAEPCTCRGPEKPHDHYSVRLPGMVRGGRVTVEQTAPGRYVLRRNTEA
jgi:hypothetical protein